MVIFMQATAANVHLHVSKTISVNPPVTASIKKSQNVDIHVLAKVFPVHLKVAYCQTLRVVSTFTGQNEFAVFDW